MNSTIGRRRSNSCVTDAGRSCWYDRDSNATEVVNTLREEQLVSQTQIGPIRFNNGHGSILELGLSYGFGSDLHDIASPWFGHPDDDVVIIERIGTPELADAARARVRPGVRVGCLLSALNFEPPEDHPDEADFTYVAALVNDFRGINDDLGTLDGVRGEHFTTLLTWQPRIDPAKTALLALITPGPLNEVDWRDHGAAARLAATFDANAYDAIIVAGQKYDPAEIKILTHFADEMAHALQLPLIIATPSRLVTVPRPFAMNFTLGTP